ncbi:MAG: hypothetical protein ACFCU6_01595 [Balneolaceae bacterium]
MIIWLLPDVDIEPARRNDLLPARGRCRLRREIRGRFFVGVETGQWLNRKFHWINGCNGMAGFLYLLHKK